MIFNPGRVLPRDMEARQWGAFLTRLIGGSTSGSFTGTLTGMSGATTGTVNYRVFSRIGGVGELCILYAESAITGTSNATSLTMTGLPEDVQPSVAVRAITHVLDNGGGIPAQAAISAAGSTITFSVGTPFNGSGFTGSGTKGINAGWSVVYQL